MQGFTRTKPAEEAKKEQALSEDVLSKDDKEYSSKISSDGALNEEHIIGFIKQFKIVSDHYRNRHKRLILKLNIFSGI